MVLLPIIEVVGRTILGRGISGSIPLVQHLTLWIALAGAALSSRSDRHLALSTQSLLPKRFESAVRIVTSTLTFGILSCLVAASVDLVLIERQAGDIVAWDIPRWVFLLALPIGFGSITVRTLLNASDATRGRLIVLSGLLIPIIFGYWEPLLDMNLVVPLSLIILAATVLGMPIFAAIAGIALLLFFYDFTPANVIPGETYRLSSSSMLPSIPLFALGGYILAEGGSSKRLMRLFSAIVGWIPGGLAIVTTCVLAFFTPLTGASGITILSMGGLLLPVLIGSRYTEKNAIGLVTASGSIGLLFFPSLPVILYGYYANQPIAQLFVGGLVPGILLVAVVSSWAAYRGWRQGARPTPFNRREARLALWEAKWELMLPVVVLGGLFTGFVTLVEASALMVFYALFVECVIYQELSVKKNLPAVFIECATLMGGFMVILSVALGLTQYFILAEIPTRALDWVNAHIESPIIFLLALNVLLILVGALMDIYSAIVVFVPLIYPMAASYGIDPIHLGIIFLVNMELGYLTPPMGVSLFLSSFRFSKPLGEIYRSTLPYTVILLLVMLLITYVPVLSLGLVEWVGLR